MITREATRGLIVEFTKTAERYKMDEECHTSADLLAQYLLHCLDGYRMMICSLRQIQAEKETLELLKYKARSGVNHD